jgi:hypothetical protein
MPAVPCIATKPDNKVLEGELSVDAGVAAVAVSRWSWRCGEGQVRRGCLT